MYWKEGMRDPRSEETMWQVLAIMYLLPGRNIGSETSQLNGDFYQRHLRPALNDCKGSASWHSILIAFMLDQVCLGGFLQVTHAFVRAKCVFETVYVPEIYVTFKQEA